MMTVGRVLADDQGFFQWLEQLGKRGYQHVFQGDRVRDAGVMHLAAQLLNQKLGGRDTGVRHQQGVFQVFV
jgi:hypothetical protein